jgi:hypothetical protein
MAVILSNVFFQLGSDSSMNLFLPQPGTFANQFCVCADYL